MIDLLHHQSGTDLYVVPSPLCCGVSQVLEAKPTLKELLLAELGLSYDPNKPLFGFIGRLEEQKGSDILNEALPEILAEDVQLVVLVR